MKATSLDPWMAAAIAAGALFVSVVAYRRRTRDLRQYLEPPLRRCGMEYVSAIAPHIFSTGPFPAIEVEFGRPQSSVAGVSGQYCEYKIVSFRNPEGVVYQLWAVVEFEMFEFRRVRWRAEHKENLPAAIVSILEN